MLPNMAPMYAVFELAYWPPSMNTLIHLLPCTAHYITDSAFPKLARCFLLLSNSR